MSFRRSYKFAEKNNALEGARWSLKKRLEIMDELYRTYWILNPAPLKPMVKSFQSMTSYEAWRKKQKNPWYR